PKVEEDNKRESSSAPIDNTSDHSKPDSSIPAEKAVRKCTHC
ncbi:hypothetical protein A2U01_0091109, partial [Trifolium medium]|nr:hypothetical protein [Trifolium medium]